MGDFNPRSLTGATPLTVGDPLWDGISIHAPSRERRGSMDDLEDVLMISIHAPSRERLLISIMTDMALHFNPRSLTGATEDLLHQYPHLQFQSTLPHGSDRYKNKRWRCYCNFNPRSLTGATKLMTGLYAAFIFQSTLPHGSDPSPRL